MNSHDWSDDDTYCAPVISTLEDIEVACDECRELQTHKFRSPADLLHALQVAAAEVDRGALRRTDVEDLDIPEQQALDSILAANVLPDIVQYRFQCAVCGDRFELLADTRHGTGGWTREGERDAL